jgi:hypothetical protein
VAFDTPSRLRKQATGETLVQIELVGACPLTLEEIEAIGGVHNPHLKEKQATGSLSTDAQTQGTILEYLSPQPKMTNPQLLSRLVMAGAQIVTVTCETRTLEDVYASAMGEVKNASLAVNGQHSMGPEGASLADARS